MGLNRHEPSCRALSSALFFTVLSVPSTVTSVNIVPFPLSPSFFCAAAVRIFLFRGEHAAPDTSRHLKHTNNSSSMLALCPAVMMMVFPKQRSPGRRRAPFDVPSAIPLSFLPPSLHFLIYESIRGSVL